MVEDYEDINEEDEESEDLGELSEQDPYKDIKNNQVSIDNLTKRVGIMEERFNSVQKVLSAQSNSLKEISETVRILIEKL